MKRKHRIFHLFIFHDQCAICGSKEMKLASHWLTTNMVCNHIQTSKITGKDNIKAFCTLCYKGGNLTITLTPDWGNPKAAVSDRQNSCPEISIASNWTMQILLPYWANMQPSPSCRRFPWRNPTKSQPHEFCFSLQSLYQVENYGHVSGTHDQPWNRAGPPLNPHRARPGRRNTIQNKHLLENSKIF